jgi:hypothetical protein
MHHGVAALEHAALNEGSACSGSKRNGPGLMTPSAKEFRDAAANEAGSSCYGDVHIYRIRIGEDAGQPPP